MARNVLQDVEPVVYLKVQGVESARSGPACNMSGQTPLNNMKLDMQHGAQ